MQTLLRLARRFPVTVAAWIFALLFWSNEELRYGLFASGLAWIPIQMLMTGMTHSFQRRTGPIQWSMVGAQLLVAGLVAYVCIQGDIMAGEAHPRVFDALLLGMLAAYGATKAANWLLTDSHGAAPVVRDQHPPPARRAE